MTTPYRNGRDPLRARAVRTPLIPECRQRFSLGPRCSPVPDEAMKQLEALEGSKLIILDNE